MAGAREVRAGEAYTELSTRDKMSAGLARAQARLRRFGAACEGLGRTMIGLGAAVAGPVVASLKMFSSLGDAAAKMARRTGLSVRAVQELGFAAKLSGTDVGSLENGIKRMQRNVYDAERGLSTSVDALRDLGLSVKDLQGLAPEDQFTLMAERMGQVEDASRRAALAQVLFGRAGTMLLPMFEKGAAGVGALRKRFRELGIALTDEEARAAEVFTDAMTDVWTSLKHGVALIGSALAPSLKDLAATVVATVREWAAWLRENRQLVAQYARLALKIGAWTVGLGAALVVVGKLAFGVKGLIGVVAILTAHPLVAAFVGVAAVLGGVGYAIDKLRRATIQLNDEADRTMAAGDKQRAADWERMDRLEKLATKERLNTDEMSEAQGIIAALTSRYGNLNLTLDRVTGTVGGLTQAYHGMTEAMRTQAIAQVEERMQTYLANMDKLGRLGPGFFESLKMGFHEITGLGGTERIGRGGEFDRQFRMYHVALARWRKLTQGGGREALTGAPAPAAAAEAEPAWLTQMHEAQSKSNDEQDAWLRQYLEKWKAAEAKKMAAAKRRIDDEARLRWASIDEEARLKDEIARAEIEATKEGIDKRLALLRLEYRARLEQAAMAGADLGLVKRLYQAQRRLLLQGAETAKVARRFEVRGQFGGLGAERLGGASTADRIAHASEETARNTKRLVSATRQGGLVFG